MSLLALVTWIIAASGGLYLLSIWLIEYDKDFHAVAATRLPPAVLAGHVMLAVGGLAGLDRLPDPRLRPAGLDSGGGTGAGGDARACDGGALARRVPGRTGSRQRTRQLAPQLSLVSEGTRDGRVAVLAAGRRTRPARAQLPAAGRHRTWRLRCRDDHAGAAHRARRRRQLIASVGLPRSPAQVDCRPARRRHQAHLARQQLVRPLAPHAEPGDAVRAVDHRRPERAVVVVQHGEAVSAGDRDDERGRQPAGCAARHRG